MGLSKACDCLPNDLIIAKFEAYGFHSISLKLFQLFFKSRGKSKYRISYKWADRYFNWDTPRFYS